jgi:putative ATP-binding cassette transporter
MHVLNLINRKQNINIKKIVILACISGLANALVLTVINIASGLVSDTSKNNNIIYYLVLFTIIISIYGLSQRRVMIQATHSVEEGVDQVRRDLIELIRHCALSTIEKIGRERIYTTISKELQTISQFAQLFIIVGQSSILIVFTSLYIAWLSFLSFLVIAGCILFGASIHLLRTKRINENLARAFKRESDVILCLTDLLDGFKEVKLSRARGDELKKEFDVGSMDVRDVKKQTHTLLSTDFVLSTITFYIAVGAIVFFIPLFSDVYSEVVTKVTAATIFLIGPIGNIVGGISLYTNANASAKNVLDLEQDLQLARGEVFTDEILTTFDEIELKNLCFQHKVVEGERAFEIGPINMNIKAGQTIFVTGGNGSGKTTFVRLLTGLYHAQKGGIYVDGKKILDERLDAYRNLYTSVFSDFHLFQYLYGTPHEQTHEGDDWLENLEMAHKVSLKDKKFSTVDLSGGQRKRLALLSSVLENRPIYIFDEWAADQDPYFRKKFYEQILPKLKDKNQTVIAITHDEKYFHLADIRFNMCEGQLTQISTPQKEG